MPANPQTPPNPDQKDPKDKSPWRKRLHGWWRNLWQDWRAWVKNRINPINNKIWVLDWAIIRFKKRVFNLLNNFSFWVQKLPYKRPASTLLFMIPLILVFIFHFQELLIACQELFIFIFPFSAIAIKPFLLSVWDAILILVFGTILGLFFFWLIPQIFGQFAKIISSAWFLFLLLLGFGLALYHPPFADFILPNVIKEDDGKVTILTWAVGGILGLLLFAQRLDAMNEQTKTANRQVETANLQVETANRQIETAQTQHEAEQFNRACELLGHDKMITRMGGITLLGALARKDPEKWHVVAVDALTHFIHDRSVTDEESPIRALIEWYNKNLEEKKWQEFNNLRTRKAPADIALAMRAIARNLTIRQKAVIQKHLNSAVHPYWPVLSKSWLNSVNLQAAYLPNASISCSFFHHTVLLQSNLTNAIFNRCNFDNTTLLDANIRNAMFDYSNITKTGFRLTKGFSSSQLAGCYYFIDKNLPFTLPNMGIASNKGKVPLDIATAPVEILPEGATLPRPITNKAYWKLLRYIF